MGRAFVLRERIQVGRRPAAVSAAAGREGALPAASAALRRRLSLPARRHRARRGVRLLCRAVRSRGERPVALPRDHVDRAQHVRTCQGVRGADRPLGTGRIQRGNPDICADHSGRQQPGVSVRRPDGPADHPDCRAEHPGREERRVRGFPRQRSSLRRGAQECTRKQQRDVPGNRQGSAVLREAGRGTGRQRTGDANRTGHGNGRDARSVVCVPSSHSRDQLPELRVSRTPGYAARRALRRRARSRQHPAAQARRDAVRRQRRLLRDRGSLVRQALRSLRGARGGAPPHVAAHDRTQSGVAVHAVPESERPVSVQIRRVRRRSHHVGGVRRPRQHRHQRIRRRLGVPAGRL